MISSHRQNHVRCAPSFPNSILLPIFMVLALYTGTVNSDLIPKGPFKGEEKIPLTLRQESQIRQPQITPRQTDSSSCTLCIDGSDPSLLDKEITRDDVPLPDCAALVGALGLVETDSDNCNAAQSSLGLFCGCPIPKEACTLCADGTSVPPNSHDVLTNFDSGAYIPGAPADTSMTCLAMESYLLVRVNNTDPVCQSTQALISDSGLCGCGKGGETNETDIKCCQEPEPSEMDCGRSGCHCCGDGNWLLGNSGPTLTAEAACGDLLPSISCEKKEGNSTHLQETLLTQLNLVSVDKCQGEMDRLETCLGSSDCDSNSNCAVMDFAPNRQTLGDFSSEFLEVVANTTAISVCQQISTSFCETVDCCTACFSQALSYSECLTKIYNEGLTEAITDLFSSGEVPSEIFQCTADNFVCQQTVDNSDETGAGEKEPSGLPVCQERENILRECLGENSCENDCPVFLGEQNYTAEALALLDPNSDPTSFDYVANLTVLVNQITCDGSQRELCQFKSCCSGCARELDSYFGCFFVTSQSFSKTQIEAAISAFEISGLALEGALKIPELPHCTIIDERMCQENITLPLTSDDGERTGRPVLVNSSFIIAVKENITADVIMPDDESMNLPLFMLEEAYSRLVQRAVSELFQGIEENLDSNNTQSNENGTATSTTLVDGALKDSNVTFAQRNGGHRVLRDRLKQLHANLEELVSPSHSRRLVVSLDTNSAELYMFQDTSCPVSETAVERQGQSLSNCIVVFGKYRVYVGEDDNVERTYIDFTSASQGLLALGGLEEALLEGDKQEIDFRVVEAYSPFVDTSFNAFSELAVDTSPAMEGSTSAAPSMISTTVAPSTEKSQAPAVPSMRPVVTDSEADKSSAASFTIRCSSLLPQVIFLLAFAPI